MAGLLGIGLTGINSAQANLLTTSHNITNANTPGYNRQTTVITTNDPLFSGAGFFGQGSKVDGVRRQYDQFLGQQVLNASARKEEFSAYGAQISQLDNLLADPNAGLSPALADFFAGVQDVATNPASIPARQALISTAESLAARFNALDTRLNEIRDLNEGQIVSTVDSINAYARQIADMNQRIGVLQVGGPSIPANDLLDQRDNLVTELNKLVKVSTVTESDGSLSVFVGSGQSLVVGTAVSQLSVESDPIDPFRGQIHVVTPNNGSVLLPDSLFTGGQLGGLLKFRGEALDTTRAKVDQIAYDFAAQFNAQHRSGLALDGQLGVDFFTTSPTVTGAAANLRVAVTTPQSVAAASAAGLANAGSARIAAVAGSGAYSLLFDQATNTYEVRDAGDNVVGTVLYDPATDSGGVDCVLPGALSGVTVRLSGKPVNGDGFSVGSVGPADNRNALALAELPGDRSVVTVGAGTTTIGSAYSQLVSFVGNKTREVQIGEAAQEAQLQQATDAQQALSGVNLDEEAANLIRYQQSYQAAARVMSVAGTLFDEILSIAR